MYDPAQFTLSNMIDCASALRGLGKGAQSMEEAAGRIVRYLHDILVDQETGAKACALVRFYKTHAYGELDPELRAFAGGLLGGQPEMPAMKCLVLLATAGHTPEWNSRAHSAGHKAIPLPSEQVIAQIPMISRLIQQFGVEVRTVLEPDPTLIMELEQKTYNVFHVPEALGSPYVPAQEGFVVPFGIKSVLGFGGMLPSGDLFAIILFAQVTIPRETGELFKTLALSAKMAVLPFVGKAIFASKPI
jgi:hypothetical protein